MIKAPFLLEACVETLPQAVQAAARGAHQLELCANLAQGGLTPSLELTGAVLQAVSIPVKVMIRPRAGDFVFPAAKIQEMRRSIVAFQALGVAHFVIGMATAAGYLDTAAIRDLATAFPDARFTVHKVIDEVRDPLPAIDALNTIPNIRSILTSGGAPTALAGAAAIRLFQSRLLAGRTVVAAGKITANNLAEVHAAIGATAYHGRKILGDLD
ncbi:MAG: copper homeostasis protein [Bacteroidetes bacterium]|nr:MAG: copper homeostasis protein [Bacteroidota bacterium]PTM07881.1 MAG: copper homeostasis protein [Bacteroidota bacterium]